MGSVGCYNVGCDECYRTAKFTTALARLDISRVSDAMVPPDDDQSKQHTLSTDPSHNRATLSLRPADVGSIGGYDVGYDECSRTTEFVTAPGRLDIAHHTHVSAAAATVTNVSEARVLPTDDTTLDPIVDHSNSHANDVPLSTIIKTSADAAIVTSVYEGMVPPDVRISNIATASAAVANGTSVYETMVPPADDQ